MSLDLIGIVPPIVTPFTADGEIDEQAFRNVVQFNLRKKVHGVCVGGSSGEGHTLSIPEFVRLMTICVEEVNGAIPVPFRLWRFYGKPDPSAAASHGCAARWQHAVRSRHPDRACGQHCCPHPGESAGDIRSPA